MEAVDSCQLYNGSCALYYSDPRVGVLCVNAAWQPREAFRAGRPRNTQIRPRSCTQRRFLRRTPTLLSTACLPGHDEHGFGHYAIAHATRPSRVMRRFFSIPMIHILFSSSQGPDIDSSSEIRDRKLARSYSVTIFQGQIEQSR